MATLKGLADRLRKLKDSAVSNFKGNVQAISSPQTRETWFKGAPVTNFTYNAGKAFAQAPQALGRGIGTAVTAPMNYLYERENRKIDERLNQTLRNRSQRQLQAGDIGSSRNTSQLLADAQQRQGQRQIRFGENLNQARKEAVSGTISTLTQLLGAKGLTPSAIAGYGGASAALGGLANKVNGGSFSQGAGEGFGKTLQFRGVNKLTQPGLDKLGKIVSPTKRFLTGIGANAVGNVVEDEILTRGSEGRGQTKEEIATSALIGGAIGAATNLKLPEKQSKQLRDALGRFTQQAQAKIRGLADLPPKLRKQVLETEFMRSRQNPKWVKTPTGLKKVYGGQEAYGAMAGIEPEYDEEGKLTGVGFNSNKAAAGLAIMGGVKAVKNGNLKFDGNYQRGDIKTLQNRLDELLGTKSFNNTGKWQADLPARQTAKRQLESFAQDGDVDAQQYLKQVTDIENEIANATLSKDQAIKSKIQVGVQPTKGVEPTPTVRIQNQAPAKDTFTFYGSKPSQQAIITPEGKQLTINTVPSKAKTPEAQQALKEGEQILQQKVSGLDYFRTPDRVLQKIGLGDQAKEIRTAYSAYTKELPQEIDKITGWFNRVGKSADASKRIFQYLDGKPIQLQGEELKVAGEIKGYLKNWASRLGLPEDKQVTNYITHLFDDQLIKKEFDPELEKLIADKVPGSVYDPFLQKRYGVAGYKEDAFQALDAYVKRATRKVHMDGALTSLEKASEDLPLQSWKYVKNYADRINLRPTDIDNLVDTAIKQSPIGYRLGQRPVANLTRNLRTAVYRGTLGLNIGSALRNLTQGANTYAELGEKWTAKGYFDATKNMLSGSKELEEVGVTGGAFVQDRALSATKKFGEKLDKVLFGAFELAETINRGAAYFGAKAKALSEGKTLEQAIQAGVDTARKTQFTFGSVDTPVGLQSDLVKTFTQLQSYNVKQAEFLLDKVQKKEIAGLVRYIAAWTLFATAGNEVLGLDWKSAIPFSGTLEGKSPVGSTPPFQLITGAARAGVQGKDKYGGELEGNAIQRIAGDQDVQNALGAMTIPGFVQGKKTLEGIQTFNKGYSETKNGRVRFPVEQTTGNQVKTALLGQYSTPEARQYFDGDRSVLGEKQSQVLKIKQGQDRNNYYNAIISKRESGAEKPTTEIKKPGILSGMFGKAKAQEPQTSQWESYFEVPEYEALPSGTNQQKAIKEDKRTKLISTILADEDVALEDQIALVNKLGEKVTPKDVEYYKVAKLDNDIKTGFVLDEIADDKDRKETMAFLETLRMPVLGKMILADGVIDDLYDQELITSAEKKYLKSLDYVNKDGKLSLKKGAGGKKINVKAAKKVSLPKIKFSPSKLSTSSASVGSVKLKLPTKSPALQTNSGQLLKLAQGKPKEIKFNKIRVRA